MGFYVGNTANANLSVRVPNSTQIIQLGGGSSVTAWYVIKFIYGLRKIAP